MNNGISKTPGNITIGMHVDINPRSDRTRKIVIQGVVSEILTRNMNHPHGVLVRLESGKTGRVKAIIDKNSLQPPANTADIPKDTDSAADLIKYIEKGESHNIEFKAEALWSSNFNNKDINNFRPQSRDLHVYGKTLSKVIIAKTIAGFLNTDGGILVIGVKENKNSNKDEIIGIEKEYTKLKDQCSDGYRRMLVDLIKDHFPPGIFNHLHQYIQINFEQISGHVVFSVTSSRSDRRVFIKLKGTDHFYIRTDASTRELQGEEIIHYCEKRFN